MFRLNFRIEDCEVTFRKILFHRYICLFTLSFTSIVSLEDSVLEHPTPIVFVGKI